MHAIVLCIAALAVGGCGLLPGSSDKEKSEPVIPLSEQPYRLAVRLVADPAINPDVNGRASPIRVLVFLVKADSNLSDSDYESIFGRDAVDPQPQAIETLHPGTERSIRLDGVKTESRLVVAAAFRDPWQLQWIGEADVDVYSPSTIVVRFDHRGVSFER